jgi:hypothetical protein
MREGPRVKCKAKDTAEKEVPISQAPEEVYKMFRDKQDRCTKVVLDPWAQAA